MSVTCRHTNEFLGAFENREPTEKEINIHRLWQCPQCKKWISLIGDKAKDHKGLAGGVRSKTLCLNRQTGNTEVTESGGTTSSATALASVGRHRKS